MLFLPLVFVLALIREYNIIMINVNKIMHDIENSLMMLGVEGIFKVS
jgi:hypothetical protein